MQKPDADLTRILAEGDQVAARARADGEATAAYYRALIDKKVPAALAGRLTQQWLYFFMGGEGDEWVDEE